MITRPSSILTNSGVDTLTLRKLIDEFTRERLPRMERARRYFDGDHGISDRTRLRGMPNNRISAPYPRYIVTMASGYLVGSPVQYADETQQTALNLAMDAYKAAKTDSVDMELARDASLYGVGVEIAYFDGEAQPRVAALDPRRAFVAYDDTVEHNPLLGVCWRKDAGGGGFTCDAYTAWSRQTFTGADIQTLVETEGGDDNHLIDANNVGFGRVPIVEYWNDSDERGDFDDVISLIDAYDSLQSDRVNDKQQFTDSLLVFTGVGDLLSDDPDDTRSAGQRLREEKALSIPDSDAKVEWLTKSLNEADTQVLADAIRSDIHKFAMVPDLTDAHFAGNVSGVAMRYKLFGLEQRTKVKERWFREALRERLRLFAAALAALGRETLDADEVTITFTRSLPVNELELAQEIATLKGTVPDRILLTQLPFISDPDAALAMLEEQRQEESARTSRIFGQYTDANNPASPKA